MAEHTDTKSPRAASEERILQVWREKGIFEKTLKKNEGKKEFIFYEGPPTANGKPGIHHLEARAFKDAIPRYKTMRGFYVRRKAGWDTHGLPVELQVEKELGFTSKKDIENFGIAEFNRKCKESVWRYMDLWSTFTKRIGYWVDEKDPYITYEPRYIETLWSIIKKTNERGLLYKDYKVVPWCPRCGTGLSSHELAQGYDTVKDLAVTVKFELVNEPKTYMLAWTTTPWTLPGNVALAVNPDIDYTMIEMEGARYILAAARLAEVVKTAPYTRIKEYKGSELVGKKYLPLYPFLRDSVTGVEKEKLEKAFTIYPANFVTTADGTGVVHTAVMYGQDDFELGTAVGLPKYHLVKDDGTFKENVGFLAGKFVKDPETDVLLIKDLAGRGLLFGKEKYEHTYPFCWRCKTPLIYFARDSWYIKMSALRKELIRENEHINWEPAHIKEGRFGEWLKEVKDWAISRERYWGTPLPVWACDACGEKEVIGDYKELATKIPRSGNHYLVMRHGEAIHNTTNTLSCVATAPHHLTDKGVEEAKLAGRKLKGKKIDLIISSPFVRTRETAAIVAEAIGYPADKIIIDDRITEINAGVYNGRSIDDYHKEFRSEEEYFVKRLEGGENFTDIKKRVGDFIYDIDQKYQGKTILIVSHDTPTWLLFGAARGENRQELLVTPVRDDFLSHAEVKELDMVRLPHDEAYEFDPHRPYIDKVVWPCPCGKGKFVRTPEVMDVWFDSGAMPFAQDHTLSPKRYPADFISEAIDQTRGWFYTLHAVGTILGRGRAYKNVICLGHILDDKGKKMSKSLGNIVDPWIQIDKFGADAIRFWMYSVNQPGESKNYDERTVDEIVKKVFNLLTNVETLYSTYRNDIPHDTLNPHKSPAVLDAWILALKDKLVVEVTNQIEAFNLFEPTRALRDFIAEFSQWYIRRSRDRFKGEDDEDKKFALATTRAVLLDCARLMAPFAPFFAEELYQKVGGTEESVHLETWPEGKKGWSSAKILESMQQVRAVVSQGLQIRAQAGIKVRQPLASVTIGGDDARLLAKKRDLQMLVRDELNVKEVILDTHAPAVGIDTTVTPALKAEGEYREFLRAVQELRKKQQLVPSDRVTLFITTDEPGMAFIKQFESDLVRSAGLTAVRYEAVAGEEIATDTYSFTCALKK